MLKYILSGLGAIALFAALMQGVWMLIAPDTMTVAPILATIGGFLGSFCSIAFWVILAMGVAYAAGFIIIGSGYHFLPAAVGGWPGIFWGMGIARYYQGRTALDGYTVDGSFYTVLAIGAFIAILALLRYLLWDRPRRKKA